MIIPRFAFLDDGQGPTWSDMIANSPTLNVSEYAGGDHPDRLRPAVSFHHDRPNSAGRR